ncbi:MAG: hypothetical protein RL757_2186 [Bacteroidota bacterium]|jgi:exonuclease SbcD
MLKILHTADWHLGKRLHGHTLLPEMRLFFDWILGGCLDAHQVDVLLIAGDIFDSANPPHEARQAYFDFLRQLISRNITVVVLGGNHDSPAVLDAPRDILQLLKIQVLGKIPQNMAAQLLVLSKNGQPEAVLGMVPFLLDADIRRAVEAEASHDRIARTRMGIRAHYTQLVATATELHPDLPLVATGHLFAKGGETSESERQIQVGNLADIDFSSFQHQFAYLALGHLHRPQKVGGLAHFRYSGSPVALSFDEIGHKKQVVLLTIDEKKLQHIETIEIPTFRELLKIDGKLEEIEAELIQKVAEKKSKNQTNLTTFVDITVRRMPEEINPTEKIREWVSTQPFDGFNIITQRILRHQNAQNTDDTGGGHLLQNIQHLSDIKPIELLKMRIQKEGIEDEATKQRIESAFLEILETLEEEN